MSLQVNPNPHLVASTWTPNILPFQGSLENPYVNPSSKGPNPNMSYWYLKFKKRPPVVSWQPNPGPRWRTTTAILRRERISRDPNSQGRRFLKLFYGVVAFSCWALQGLCRLAFIIGIVWWVYCKYNSLSTQIDRQICVYIYVHIYMYR